MVVFFLSFVSALEVDFSCPDSVKIGEEFSCDIGFSGDYDVKVDLLCGSVRCARIWNGEFWGSTYYFIKEFDASKVKLKVVDDYEGDCDGKLRLRKTGGSGYNYEESFSIDVSGGSVEEENEKDGNVEVKERVVDEKIVELSNTPEKEGVIALNSNVVLNGEIEEVVYESKNQKIRDWVIYFFAGFLIFVIVVLVVLR